MKHRPSRRRPPPPPSSRCSFQAACVVSLATMAASVHGLSSAGVGKLSTREITVLLDSTRSAAAALQKITRETTVLEIDDYEWWERQTADDNPYGGKIWPGAIAAATRLVELAATGELTGHSVVELGAGNGFCSLAAAALPGPRSVLATDISEMSLELVRRAGPLQRGGLVSTLDVDVFDVMAKEVPLPDADLLVVADMLYDDALAVAVAKRVCEAVERGTEVVIGGDPKRAARMAFLNEVRKKLPEFEFEPQYSVKVPSLAWKAKGVEVAHVRPAGEAGNRR